ncbi:MAG: glycoside hydrolase family 2 [Bacteroidetes bacterium]|nr:glycoside hydrolase family 2 [Bacteroidota bacterium]
MIRILVKRCFASLLALVLLMPLARGQGLRKGWFVPPDSIQTSVYWYWISGNISKEGVVKDLEAMKRAGINRAFIGNVAVGGTPDGKVKLFSPEWWDILHVALKTATRLHIDIGLFDSPGWSGIGGPWVRRGGAMRYLAVRDTMVHGPGVFRGALPAAGDSMQDVRVIAYPRPYGAGGGSIVRDVHLGAGDSVVVEVPADAVGTVRSLVLTPERRAMRVEGAVEVLEDGGGYRKVAGFVMDRSNDALNVGFNPYGPLAVSMPAVKGRAFRVVFYHWSPGSGIASLRLSEEPVVAQYVEKSLGKMHPTPHPFWSAYQWPEQAAVDDSDYVIDPSRVVDISSHMDAHGVLRWDVPPGDWTIVRTGMLPTGVVNSPAAPEGTGLQGDKMNKQSVFANFDAFIGEVLRRIPVQDRACFKVVVEDSYEVGGLNWTDGMIDSFKVRYRYDPTPYLPVLMGRVVGSEDKSDRFLWDLRRFVADRVAYDYVGGLREASHGHGLSTWLENYGHWGFPAEFLQYGGQSDEVGGEFWAEGDLGDIENRSASSCAHIYGKSKVSAESFTAAGNAYGRYPALLKARGDRFFCEGVNNSLLHVFISQPDERLPGTNTWFGTEFNRHNVWFDQLDVFTGYLKRCNYLLRSGRYVADVAYFIGEDAPKMTGVRDPELPKGYSYDYINAEVIEKRLTVRGGRWTLPDGLSYKVLVLPKLKTMRPQVLRRLFELVKMGGVLMGPAPSRSPSLEDYGVADSVVLGLSHLMWDGGMVVKGDGLEGLLRGLGVAPDLRVPGNDSVLFIHRTAGAEEIYFISNQTGRKVGVAPVFRVKEGVPELWDPLLGTVRALPEFVRVGGMTRVPLRLSEYGSCFVVFRRGGVAGTGGKNFPTARVVEELKGPWMVRFDGLARGPLVFDSLVDWATSKDSAIRYFSGKAVYRCGFRVDRVGGDLPLFLDLGRVGVMAKVRVNGVYAGGVWTPPYRVDIRSAVKKGMNDVEVEVVNTWVNRLIGDSRLPEGERKTWMNFNPYKPGSPLMSSGLLGPVRVVTGYGDADEDDRKK